MKYSLNYFKGLIILSGLALALSVTAQNIEFKKPYLLKADGEMLNSGGVTFPSPIYGDYDGDGKNELLVGFWNSPKEGNVWVFENKGKKRKPKFTKIGLLDADGKPAAVSAY